MIENLTITNSDNVKFLHKLEEQKVVESSHNVADHIMI